MEIRVGVVEAVPQCNQQLQHFFLKSLVLHAKASAHAFNLITQDGCGVDATQVTHVDIADVRSHRNLVEKRTLPSLLEVFIFEAESYLLHTLFDSSCWRIVKGSRDSRYKAAFLALSLHLAGALRLFGTKVATRAVRFARQGFRRAFAMHSNSPKVRLVCIQEVLYETSEKFDEGKRWAR